MSTVQLSHAEHDADFRSCFAVMRTLRPHISDAEAFSEQARRQLLQGYRLMVAWQEGKVHALAGYRVQENFLYGRFLYVDDLVTTSEQRRHGLGATLIDALRKEARHRGCAHLVIDTALSNALGQRFYYHQGLLAVGMHFTQVL